MTEVLFHVVFSGSVAEGQDRATVRARLVELFGSPAKVDALFSGDRVLVKRYVREADARRYERAFAAAGAPCELVPVEVETGPGGGGGKRTLTYGSPAARPRRTTPVYGSPVFADDEAGLAEARRPAAVTTAEEVPAPYLPVTAPAPPLPAGPPPAAPLAPPPPAAPPTAAGADAGVTLRSLDDESRPGGPIPDLDLPAAPGGGAAVGVGVAAVLVSPAIARHVESPFESGWLIPESDRRVQGRADGPGREGGVEVGAAAGLAANALDTAGDDPLRSFHRVALAAPIDDAAPAAALALERRADDALPSLDLRGLSNVDLALPRLVRDPDTGKVLATPPGHPERPGRLAGARAAGAPHPGSEAAGASPWAPATAVPVLRQELEGAALDGFTPEMVAALERSRFGLTVTAVSFFAGAALLGCGGLGSLITLNGLGFVAAIGAGACCLFGGLRLWSALQALTEAVRGSAVAAARALEEQARFFRLWGIVQAASLALVVLALLVGLATGAAAGRLGGRGRETAPAPTIVGYGQRATADGFESRFTLADGTRRAVRCDRDPQTGFRCGCWLGAVQGATFDTRAEPTTASAATELAREGCDWELVLDLDR